MRLWMSLWMRLWMRLFIDELGLGLVKSLVVTSRLRACTPMNAQIIVIAHAWGLAACY